MKHPPEYNHEISVPRLVSSDARNTCYVCYVCYGCNRVKREASKVQFVQMYAGHPHFCIIAVPLAEIHQLQVRLKRGIIVEQLGCFNSDV